MTDYAIYATILLLPFYVVRFSVFGLPTNILEISALFAILLWILNFKKSPAPFSLSNIYWLSFLLIFLGLALSAFLNPDWMHEAGIIKGWFVLPFIFFLILLDSLKNSWQAEKILRLIYVSSSGVGFVSILYLLTGKMTFDGRLGAFYLSPNHLAMFLTPGIIIGFFTFLNYVIPASEPESVPYYFSGFRVKPGMTSRLRSFYFVIFSLAISFTSLYFTFSYGAWIALILSLLVALLIPKILNLKKKIIAAIALIVVSVSLILFQMPSQKLAGLVSSDERSSLASRMMIWKSAWKIGADNIIWGIGPGNFQAKYLEYQKYFPPYLEWAVPQPHNLYLAFWLQTGILGLIGFLMLVGYFLFQSVRIIRTQKNDPERNAPFAIILYFLIHGLIDTPYWKNDLAFLFWIVLVLGLFFLRQADPEQMAVRPIDKK